MLELQHPKRCLNMLELSFKIWLEATLPRRSQQGNGGDGAQHFPMQAATRGWFRMLAAGREFQGLTMGS